MIGFLGTRSVGHVKPAITLPWWRIAGGLAMAYVGGAATITMSGIGYSNGWSGLMDPFAVVAGGLIVLLVLTKTRMPKSTEGIATYFAAGNSYLRIIYSLATVFVYALMVAAQVLAITKLAQPYIGEPYSTLFAMASFILIVLYVYLGGITSVTRTDLTQLGVVSALFVLPSLAGLLLLKASAISGPPILTTPLDTRTLLYLSLSMLFVPLSQDVWLRARVARSVTDARLGVLGGVIIYAVIVTLAVTVGFAMAGHGTILGDAETVLPIFFRQVLGMAGIVPTIFVLSAVFSTLDSFAFNLLNTFDDDLLQPIFGSSSRKRRLATAGILIAACLFIALFAQSVLSLVLTGLMVYVSVIGPGILCRQFGLQSVALWLPALITLVAVFLLGALNIRVMGEPYTFFFGHLAMIGIIGLFTRHVRTPAVPKDIE